MVNYLRSFVNCCKTTACICKLNLAALVVLLCLCNDLSVSAGAKYKGGFLRSSNDSLASLTISTGTLSPVFAAGTTGYTDSVANAATSVTVTPASADPAATITLNGVIVASGSASAAVSLNVGNNPITIAVTSADASVTNTYTINVVRAPSSDDTLSNLAISNGTLSPSFSSATTDYATSVVLIKKQHTVYTIGDSITANGSYQIDLASLLNDVFTFVDFAIPGDLSPDMIKRFPAIINASPDYVIILAGFGDIFYGANAAQVETNLQTMYTEAHNAGIRVIALTITPWKGFRNYWTPALQSIQDTVNAWIPTAKNVDYVIDTYNALLDPSNPYQLLPAYDGGDHLHPGAAGQAEIAAAIYAGATFIPNPAVDQSNTAATSLTVTPTTNDANATVTVNGTPVAGTTASQSIPLSPGPNIINTIVTAQDGTTAQTYTINATGAPSNNATLADLSLSTGGLTLTPVFATGTTNYSTSVVYSTDTVAVTPTTLDAYATVTVNGMAVSSGTASAPVILAFGSNTITTKVTAQDGITIQTYTITITRPLSNVADLTSLAVSSGALTPAFATVKTIYTDTVVNAITSVSITPVTFDANASVTLTLNGIPVTPGSSPVNMTLNPGQNYCTIKVTAQDGITVKTYSLAITRLKSSDATLAGLTLSAGTPVPVFVPGTTSYLAPVSYTTTTLRVIPIANNASATIKVNGVAVASGAASGSIVLATGYNTIAVAVTSQDKSTTDTYTIIVTRTSPNANLSNLTISSGTLTPAFATAATSYTANVTNTVSSIKVAPTTSDPAATVTVNGLAVPSGTSSVSLPLIVGANRIIIKGTAFDGTVKTYVLTVTRAASSNANLANLTISSGTLSPAFATTTNSYTTSVNSTVTSLQVTLATSDPTATVTVNGTTVASGTPSTASLTAGPNYFTIKVKAQDGTLKTYALTVTKLKSSDATLAGIAISAGTLTPAFAAGTNSYTASVSYPTTSTRVTPTVNFPGAVVKVNGTMVASGSASASIPLATGYDTISVTVTAQDGVTTNNYTITVIRTSPNANLSSLAICSGTLSPAFATNTNSYKDTVINTTTSVTVTPVTSDAVATVAVNGKTVASGTASQAIPLTVGVNGIAVKVTAFDGTVKTYGITVIRASTGSLNSFYVPVSVIKPVDSPEITGDGIVVHQGVSPNGDGINDFLLIDGIAAYPDNKLLIMDRNGLVIYETKGYDNSSRIFDGHSNKTGAMQLPGTYFYSLDYMVNGQNKHKTGYIILKY